MNQLLMKALSALYSGEEGQTVVEYALILALVTTAGITLLTAIGHYPSSIFSSVNSDF